MGTCVLLATDFTVYNYERNGYGCSDEKFLQSQCQHIGKWRSIFLKEMEAYNGFVWANYTDTFKMLMVYFGMDAELLSTALDLAVLVQAKSIIDMGGHFYEVANRLEHGS